LLTTIRSLAADANPSHNNEVSKREKSLSRRLIAQAPRTGKANFDISEWMLITLLAGLKGIPATLAMLCKTATARRVLKHAWSNNFDIDNSSLHIIDAKKHFGVSVTACLLIIHTGQMEGEHSAKVFSGLTLDGPTTRFGLIGSDLVADLDLFGRYGKIEGTAYRRWRSGVKHDAAKIMELVPEDTHWVNQLGERHDLETTWLYPFLKSSDVANGRLSPSKYVLMTQERVESDTTLVSITAPKTWQYLLDHSAALDGRKSSIYTNRPRFAIFGVGPYTLAPWKVAILGLYKNLDFRVVGNFNGKPIIVDDTCYCIPCETQEEAEFFCALLNSEVARGFIKSLAFIDAKRPITIDVLK